MHPLPAHLRSLTDSTYLAAGAGVFVLALAAQFGLYVRLLHRPLQSRNLELARPAMTRWLKAAIALQTAVLVASGVYVAVTASGHPRGVAWVAPALGAVAGTALPLQVAVATILRTARRL